MTAPRNVLMRIRTAHNETVLEIIFIVTSAVLVGAYGVSTTSKDIDGATLPSFHRLTFSMLTQWGIEMLVDAITMGYLTVVDQQPVLEVSHRLFRGWTAVVCTLVLLANAL